MTSLVQLVTSFAQDFEPEEHLSSPGALALISKLENVFEIFQYRAATLLKCTKQPNLVPDIGRRHCLCTDDTQRA